MAQLDLRKKYIMVLDTETCPIDRTIEGVKTSNMLVYDIGFAVVDKQGNVYKTGSYVVAEIMFGEMDKMQTAYYANKLPQYYEQIARGERQVKTLKQISRIIREVIKEYNVSAVSAHNAYFDFFSLKNTQEYLNQEYSVVPYIEWWDTNRMAKVIAQQKTYQRFCERNGYLTKYNKPQTKAEVLYRYISNDNDFIESHTGLEDVMIEKEIMTRCLRQHKKMTKLLFTPKGE